MDESHKVDLELLDLIIKEDLSYTSRKSPSSDGVTSVEKKNENLGATEEDMQNQNKIKDFLMDERIPWDSTIYSQRPSTSGGIAQEHGSHCFSRDKGKEITKSNTHNLGGNEKQQKETHDFKTSDYVSFISENIQGVEKVTGDKKCDFQCKTCGKQFTYLRGLKRHEVVLHTGERRYPCDYCDKACRDSYALKEHVRKHTGEKPFSCLQCPKRFRSSSNLSEHKLLHLQERPYYPCPDCEKRFTQKGSMNFHRKTSCKKSDLSK